ncbi:MAG: hypothetical protein Q7T59_01285 [Candidatus Woesebacteria bacterium]|nr:hypothetical protein [Candidatus Woesebacteria bacterium]
MPSKIKYICLTFLIFLIFPQKIDAAFSFTIDNISNSIISDKEQAVSATLVVSDLPSGDSYFRIGIDEGSSYVGYNKVGIDWIKLTSLSGDEINKTCSKYLKISSDGTYIIDFKIGNDVDVVNGEHILKAHRFRSTCTIDTLKPEIAIVILLPTPIPSPSPSLSPTQVPTQEPTSTPTKTPTTTPTVSPTPKPTPTKIPTIKPTSTPTETTEETFTNMPTLISQNSNSSTPEGMVAGASTTLKSPIIAIFLIAAGLLLMIVGGVNLYKKMKTEYNSSNENT